MSDFWQQIVVGALVLGAVIYLILRGRGKSCGKGGDCGCSVKKPFPPADGK